MNSRVGIVVPTLGQRPEFLEQCLTSIRKSGDAFVVLVAPKNFDSTPLVLRGLIDKRAEDPGAGLSAAINYGFTLLPKDVSLINWLGDDDILHPGSLTKAVVQLSHDPSCVMVFGCCDYIDPQGKILWVNKSGQWAVPLLRFGPDLIPQPGALFRRSAFEEVGGLNSNWDWAFDLDLFIKLSKKGKIKFIDESLASFRWHQDSLSVGSRSKSVSEASRVRVSYLPKILQGISPLWEFPVRQATLIAGHRMNKLGKRTESV